ncbi:hypothetical protein NDU88_008627 [Pleurodeles waltl]|uniref:Uncharacterized protein n=1 Tax=Pleurodeles waltl TaxID=8319 RepID=A0AAV7QT06_PLEWA|nr:hypothetical protein NDU88_008627 [Pleurodeles waltl]
MADDGRLLWELCAAAGVPQLPQTRTPEPRRLPIARVQPVKSGGMRVTGLEHQMESLESHLTTAQDRDQDLLYLRSKITDLEDRSRRDNIRLFRFPENEVGPDVQAFRGSVLPKMTLLTFDPPHWSSSGHIGWARNVQTGPRDPARSSHVFCGTATTPPNS